MNKILLIIVIIVIIAVLFVISIFLVVNKNNKIDFEMSDVSGWETYSSQRYGFEFKHPPNFTKEESGSTGLIDYFLSLKKIEDNNIIHLGMRFEKDTPISKKTIKSLNAKEIVIQNKPYYVYFFWEQATYEGVAIFEIEYGRITLTYGYTIGGVRDAKKIEKIVQNDLYTMLSTIKFF